MDPKQRRKKSISGSRKLKPRKIFVDVIGGEGVKNMTSLQKHSHITEVGREPKAPGH